MASQIYNASNMSKSDVKKMQNALIDAGYSVGSSGADGIWGKDTQKALSAFKAATGGSNTYGTTVGNETFRKLYGSNSSNSAKTATPSKASASTGESATPQLSSGTAYVKSQDELDADALATYEQMAAEAAAPYEAQMQSAISSLNDQYNTSANQLANIYNQQKALADEDADDAARQQYIAYKQNKNRLGEQLSTAGITGGASETALNSILNAYSQGLATNEAARQDALTELGNTYQNDLSNLQATLQGNMADINNQYGQAIAEAKASAKADAQTAYEEAQKQNEVAEWNNKVLNDIQELNPKYVWVDSDGKYHYSSKETTANTAKAAGNKVITRSGVSDSTAKWNESVAKKIASVNPKYTWTDSDGKLHWSNNQSTANIAKANGYKVATRTDAKTTKASSTTKKKVVSTKSDDTKKGDDDPFKSGGNSKSDSYSEVLKIAKIATATPATYENAVKYVKNSGLTQKQKEKVLKEVGLL